MDTPTKLFDNHTMNQQLEREMEIYQANSHKFNDMMKNGDITKDAIADFYMAHMAHINVMIGTEEVGMRDMMLDQFKVDTLNVPVVIHDNNNIFNLLCNLIVRNPVILEKWFKL